MKILLALALCAASLNAQRPSRAPVAPAAGPDFVHSELLRFRGRNGGDNFGESVANAGDVNGDGVTDVVVGAWLDDEAAPAGGSVSVYSGLDGTRLRHHLLGAPGDRFGFSVDGLGDVNGDGCGDLVVSAPDSDPVGFQSGTVYVISGRDGAILRRIQGAEQEQRLGQAVAGIGDADGDGVGDFVVSGDPGDTSRRPPGFARLYSGATGALLQQFSGPSPNSLFGEAIAAAGDVDRDGRADWIVGAAGDDRAGANTGSATVYSGRDGRVLHLIFGTRGFGYFGVAVSSAGDVNFDKHAEFMVGALNIAGIGSVRVFDGRDGLLRFELFGEETNDEFGRALACAGDLDLDGRADLLVGSACDLELLCGRAGYVRAHSGLDGRLLGRVRGTPNQQFGFALDSLGDLDGDRIPDFVVGAFRDRTAGADAGAAFVFSGSPLNRR